MKHLRSIERGKPKKIRPRQELRTQLTEQEVLEGKEKEFEEMTKSYLENVDFERIEEREQAQKKLAEFLETASEDEKKYAETLRRLFGLHHRDWARLGFETEKVEVKGKEREIPNILAKYGEKTSDELKAQSFEFEGARDKVPDTRAKKIEELVDAAYPEYWLVQYWYEKENTERKAKDEKEDNLMYG